jgi:hypothetical protein
MCLTVYIYFIYTNRMLYQCPPGVSITQELELVSGFVRGVFSHKFLARFYKFQRIQCCGHKKKTERRWQVIGYLVFGTLGPTSPKPFLSLSLSPSPSWPLARSAPSTLAQSPLKNDHLCFPRGLQNKRLSKGKKGVKKKVVDPFTRKGQLLPSNLLLESPG